MIVSEWRVQRTRIAQTIDKGLEYAFLSGDDRQCYPLLYCKEFLIDCVWATVNGRPTFLYGLFFNPESNPPVCLEKCRVLLRNRDDSDFAGRVPNCLKFVRSFERMFKFKKSELTQLHEIENEAEDHPEAPVFLMEGSPRWMHAPPLVSLYALLLRVGMGYNGAGGAWNYIEKIADGKVLPYFERDRAYLRVAKSTIKDIAETGAIRFLSDMAENWSSMSVWNLHENGGIVSLADGWGKRVMPAWYPGYSKEKEKVTALVGPILVARQVPRETTTGVILAPAEALP